MTALVAQDLCVTLGHRPVLTDIGLTLKPGRLTVVIGPNGAGKSTLLRALAGLVVPTSGSIALGESPLARLSAARRAQSIAYLPQGGTIAWPLPVRTVAALGRLPHGERPDALRSPGIAAVASAIAAVGLKGFEDRPAHELSGGERARVLMARALATETPVLLADEPVAALDPRHQLMVLDVLKQRAAAGAVVVAVMHDLALAARFADEIVVLGAGSAQACGPPDIVLTETLFARVFGIHAQVRLAEGRISVIADRPVAIGQ